MPWYVSKAPSCLPPNPIKNVAWFIETNDGQLLKASFSYRLNNCTGGTNNLVGYEPFGNPYERVVEQWCSWPLTKHCSCVIAIFTKSLYRDKCLETNDCQLLHAFFCFNIRPWRGFEKAFIERLQFWSFIIRWLQAYHKTSLVRLGVQFSACWGRGGPDGSGFNQSIDSLASLKWGYLKGCSILPHLTKKLNFLKSHSLCANFSHPWSDDPPFILPVKQLWCWYKWAFLNS